MKYAVLDYEIIDAIWWTPIQQPAGMISDYAPTISIGMVAIKTGHGNKWKAYIGFGVGDDEGLDSQRIAAQGAKVTPEMARAAFPRLDPEEVVF